MVSYLKDTEGVAGRTASGRLATGHYLNGINLICRRLCLGWNARSKQAFKSNILYMKPEIF